MAQGESRPVVAFFRHTVLPPSETWIADKAALFRRHDVHYFGRERGSGDFPIGRVDLVRDEGERRFAARAFYTLTGRSNRLLAGMRRAAPVLVHGHFGVDGLYAIPFARALAVPLVVSFYGFDATRSLRSLLFGGKISHVRFALRGRRLIEAAARIVAPSRFIRDRLVDRGFPEERIVVNPPGVDPRRFHRRAGEDDGRTVLAVGRLVPVKGTEFLIRAAILLREKIPALRVVIAGDGPLRSSLEGMTRDLGLGAVVLFRGVLSHDEVAREMRRAAVFCQPSVTAADGHEEGLGVTLLEAAATGLPLVGSRSGGIAEVVRESGNGFLVEERDVQGLASRLAFLLGDGELRLRMGAAGRAMVEKEFDLRVLASDLEDLYDDVLAECRS